MLDNFFAWILMMLALLILPAVGALVGWLWITVRMWLFPRSTDWLE